MSGVPRSTIEELIFLYKIEPTLVDLYVEGATDKFFYKWLTRSSGISKVNIRPIESVEFKTESPIEGGNKGKLIYLAERLEQELPKNGSAKVLFVTDADLDHLLGSDRNIDNLILTDYSCKESYYFNLIGFSKFLDLYAMLDRIDLNVAYNSISEVLKTLFLVRATSRLLNLTVSWIDVGKNVQIAGSTVTLDLDGFLGRYLSRVQSETDVDLFKEKLSYISRNCLLDQPHLINGHDYICIIKKFLLSNLKKKSIARDTTTIERALASTVELAPVQSHSNIQRLICSLRGS